jgi:nucleotide-binding universal stress UspA family protein
MRKLFVPVDGSEASMRALDCAIDLCRKHSSFELVIATAHELATANPRVLAYIPLEKLEQVQREHSEEALKPAVERARAAGITFKSVILTGETAQAIVDEAQAQGCDCIVMGTRGMGAVGNLLMGSTATKVVHLTRLPVMLVK